MSGDNGKGGNGKLVPARKKPGTFMGHLREHLAEYVERPDGRLVSREQAIAEMIVTRALYSLTPITERQDDGTVRIVGYRDWDKSLDHLLGRIAPVPREQVEQARAVAVKVGDTNVAVEFIDRVKAIVGREEISPDDVLDVLDREVTSGRIS